MHPLVLAALIVAGYFVVVGPLVVLLGRFCGVADRSLGVDQEGRW